MDPLGLSADISTYLFSDRPEREFSLSISKEKARQFGQYFTPYAVAKYMADWINQARLVNHVLDPAAGLGIFFRAILEGNPEFSGTFYGNEIDSLAFKRINELFSQLPGISTFFERSNYLEIEKQRKYDAIVCNPPYILYKRIHNREDLIKKIELESGLNINPQSNIYTYFIIRAALALATNGRGAFLVPSEFLNSEFGVPIKEFLINRNLIKKILLFNPESSIFHNAITTSSILLLENNLQSDPIQFASLVIKDDTAYESELETPIMLAKDPTQKWTSHFNINPLRECSPRLIPLSKIGHVSRGIATGHNRFFTFDCNKKDRFEIPNECLLPCLTRASQARTPFFTQSQFDKLAISGKSIYLFDANQNPDAPAVQAYLQLGEANGSHKRFLTHNRDPWYRIENRPPAPILFSTFSRNQLHFIRNEAGAFNLTCFHSIYLKQEFLTKLELMMAYLLTPFSHSIILCNRREYGNGLIKFEPNDLNSALIIDIAEIDSKIENAVLELYYDYRNSVLVDQPDSGVVQTLNELFSSWVA